MTQTDLMCFSPSRWPAPAKLNLMLRIVGRRVDGYHLLQTVFQFIDWCDWLTFHPCEDGSISLQTALLDVPEQDNLIVRAANLLKSETGCVLGAKISLEKNLPMGGGLGGGSSDAATTLLALNTLWNLNLSKEHLLTLGLRLGADVPVFIYGHAAWAEGIGENLCSIDLPEQWAVLIKPDCHVVTKEIFLAKDLTRDSKSITMRDFTEGDQTNDCLAVVCQRYPIIAEALKDLANFADARLTGTGACVFGLFSSYNSALEAHQQLQDRWQTYLVKTVNNSPLYGKLSS